MFKKSRRKIVASIMTVLVLLWSGTLGVIYGSSYCEVSARNREMLSRHAQLYRPDQPPKLPDASLEEFRGQEPTPPRSENTPAFQLSTFYSVAMDKSGQLLSINNPQSALYTDQELTEAALWAIRSGKASGTTSRLLYQVEDKGRYTLVAFMDNTLVRESMSTLFRYTLIFGGLAILMLFFLAVYLARRIVQPLEESYQKQRQFISDAGHELKTPVSVVNANSELLFREIGENQWLSNIRYENQRMGALVTQLLELARTEAVSPRMELMDLSRLVRGEALPFESMIYEKGISLSCEITDHLMVTGSSSQLRQLVSILLDNALEHCGPGKEISLTLKLHRHTALLSVCNDGPEIPQEQRAQLFERFYRLDPARTGEEAHYGLGLAIAKAIVLAHHGRIEVGCGDGKVTFLVRLPLKKQPPHLSGSS